MQAILANMCILVHYRKKYHIFLRCSIHANIELFIDIFIMYMPLVMDILQNRRQYLLFESDGVGSKFLG